MIKSRRILLKSRRELVKTRQLFENWQFKESEKKEPDPRGEKRAFIKPWQSRRVKIVVKKLWKYLENMFYSSTFAPAIERDAVVTWWKRGWGTRKDRNRGMRLEDPSECPEVVPKELPKKINRKKTSKNIWKIKIKILTFAPRFWGNRLRRVLWEIYIYNSSTSI